MRSFSSPYFPVFRMNTVIYGVNNNANDVNDNYISSKYLIYPLLVRTNSKSDQLRFDIEW